MRILFPLGMPLLGLLLAACGQGAVPADAPLPRMEQGDGRVEWRGLLPCADCDGIQTLLVLERRGDVHRYDLVETFLADQEGARFAESGRWGQQGAMLTLEGEGGASRHYALLPDGRLQPRDAGGRPFRRRGDDLVPADAFAP
ncbi:MAG: copper resistance protein NlpE N-terminal domain-containing protein [Luteimonas sp.]